MPVIEARRGLAVSDYSGIGERRIAMGIKRVDVTPVYVHDQDRALDFFVVTLGMEKVRDDPMGNARWVQVRPKGAETSLVLVKGFAD